MKWNIWEKIMFGLTITIVIGFVLSIMIYGGISSYKEYTYCKNNYPPRISEISFNDNSWGTVSGIENGYIRCCRYYYELHEKKTECQVLPYLK